MKLIDSPDFPGPTTPKRGTWDFYKPYFERGLPDYGGKGHWPLPTTSPATPLKDSSTLEPGADSFDYDVFRKAISDVAEQTRGVSTFGYEDLAKIVGEATAPIKRVTGTGKYQPPAPHSWKGGHKPWGLTSGYGRTIDPSITTLPQTPQQIQLEAAIQSYRSQYTARKAEAGKAAEALTMQGAATEASMRRLGELQQEAYTRQEKAGEIWGAAATKAEEYVQSAQLRTQQALSRLDEINASISEGRDFAKAHAMNAAVQAALGSMSEQEDQIVQRYGVDSKEYQQFQAKRAQTLSTAQSGIETSYRQMAEQQSLTYMNASNELQWKEDMYSSFQEQQHVETLRYLAQANDAYDMQLAQYSLTIEQLRSAGMENMANWLVQTPVFYMDIQPFATLVAELLPGARQRIPRGWERGEPQEYPLVEAS